MINEIKWSKDGKVCFEPITHTYWNGPKQLKGVTSYISELHSKFDATAKAAEISDTPWELIRQWRVKGDSSRDNGTKAHAVFETYFETGEVVIKDGAKDHVSAKFIQDYFISGKLQFIECESLVYNDELASMRDAVVKNNKGQYFIFDWKTNEEIKRANYGRYMLPPYQHLPDSTIYHYSLQTRLYQQMSKDYPIEDCYIIHLKENDYEFIKAENI